MNTKIYGSIFKKRLSLIVVVMAVTTVMAVVGTALLPQQKNVSLSIAVDVSDQQDTSDYKYSRYYGAEASEKFATTVSSWFQSPEIVQRMFEDAGLDPGTTSLRKLAGIFDTEPLSAQNVEVDFIVGSDEEANKLLAAVSDMVTTRTETLNHDEEAVFVAILARPIIVDRERSLMVNSVVGLIVGLIISIALAALIEYWRKNPTPSM
ncbi:hypothetical protein ACFL0Z_01880 [Patescibacteria group bacterium]